VELLRAQVAAALAHGVIQVSELRGQAQAEMVDCRQLQDHQFITAVVVVVVLVLLQ
jgi:hypothetical protein